MKTTRKALMGLFFAAVLTISAFAQDSGIRSLGDGYETKTRQKGEQEITLVHFPQSAYGTDAASVRAFKAGVDTALIKLFACKAFKECKPEVVQNDQGITVNIGLDVYRVLGLFDSDEDNTITGIVLIKVPIRQQ